MEDDRMTYVTVDPLRSLVRLQSEMSKFVRDAFENDDASSGAFVPPVDIVERGGDLVLLADLPGVALGDIDVAVENRTLTLSGERKEGGEATEGTVYRNERPYGRFTRTFALPATIDVARISAEHRNGVLRVVLPKAEEARPRRIEIRQA
jgi:HSP20 family protein